MHLKQGPVSSVAHNLSYQITVQCAASCVAAAVNGIETIHKHEYPRIETLSPATIGCTNAWWNNVLYLYSAATALIAGCICRDSDSVVGSLPVHEAWTHAIQLLRRYSLNGPWVRRLTQLLETLAAKSKAGLVSRPEQEQSMAPETSYTPPEEDHGAVSNTQQFKEAFGSSQEMMYPSILSFPLDFLSTDLVLNDAEVSAFLENSSDPFASLSNGAFGG